jgi:NitT/TauT family transport system permease protein
MKKVWNQILSRGIDLSGLVVFFFLWEFVPRLGLVNEQFIPPLSKVLLYLWKLASDGSLFIHTAASLQRMGLGLCLAILIGVPLGMFLGGAASPTFSKQLKPLLKILGQINAFSLFPLFILFFGIGEFAKIAIIFWSTVWPVLFTTILGVQQVDPLYIKSARSIGADRLTIFRKVILPGAAPVIFTGIRSGATQAFLMLMAAEEVGAKAGLGWVILNSAVNSIMPRLFAAAIVIAILGLAINYFILFLEHTIIDWNPEP